MRRLSIVIIVAGLGAAMGSWIYRSSSDRTAVVVHDLADRLPFAARTGGRNTIIFGWPDAEPRLGRGFGGDPETRGREKFLWVRQGASLKLEIDEPSDRALIFDLEAYPGIEDQRLALTANGVAVGEREVSSRRSRIRFDWPAATQTRLNDLALEFTRSIVPASEGGGSGDTRDFAAALFSLVVGDANDSTLDLLRESATPHPYEVIEKNGVPSLILPGGSRTSFAFRLPGRARVEFESALSAWSVASGGKGSLEISFESTGGSSLPSARIPLSASSLPTRIELPGSAGVPFLIAMDVISDQPGLTFAQIRAPRILGEPPSPPPASSAASGKLIEAFSRGKPNVLLIVLDAARALSFGSYGHSRKTTPHLDRLASEGFIFDNAYTTAAYTLAAMSSVWTSQAPDRHHGEVAFSAKIPKDRLMLAEVLSAQGIHTAGFVANGVAGAFNGFDRGFEEFDEPWKKYGSQAAGFRRVIPPFLDRMKNDGTRFFAYVHYREPHHPYDPPPPYNTRFGPDAPIPKALREGGPRADAWLKGINQGAIKPSPEEIDHLRRLYDGNLAFADAEFGFLRDELESRGLLDNTALIVIGDHGEGLFEHGYVGHNTQVFEETARVPLIVSLPKALRASNPAARISALVDLTDIAPTVLEVFGLSGAGGSARAFQGHSLLQKLAQPGRDPAADSREVLTRTVWERPVYALRNASHTFIYNTATTESALFDRSGRERPEDKEHDFLPRAPLALRETYRQTLLAWVASLKRRAVAGDETRGMSPQQCGELKALGYLAATFVCPKS